MLYQKFKTSAFVILLSAPAVLFAQGKIKNPLGTGDSLFGFLNGIIDALLQLGAVVAVVAVIYAGFLFVTAQGDEKKITTAKAALLYTVIGLAILLGARIISSVIENTINSVSGSL
jgi:hypothetical protein